MPYLTQLAAVARRTGYPVTEVPGWTARGHGPQPSVQGVVCHHTGGAATGDYPSLGVVRDGRSDLAGPLSHFGLGRSGRIYVIAAGRCWHNAPSTSPYHTNSASLGIEAENTGTGQAWPAAQLDAYQKLVAEICREFDLPASRVKAHREVNAQKDDPRGIDMNDFRAGISRIIAGEDDDMKPSDNVPVGKTWAGEFDHDAYPAEYLWVESTARGRRIERQLAALATKVGVDVDESAIVRGVLAGLSPDVIAQAVVDAQPPDMAKRVVDELTTRLEV